MKGDFLPSAEMNAEEEEGESAGFLLQPIDGDSPDLDFRISPLKSFRSEGPCPTATNDDSCGQFSHRDVLKENQRQKPYCSSPKTAEGKENIDVVLENNFGIYSSLEKGVQARKGKRAGGCNLRKSLAWNTAFSTEEGILNPQELSILSGSSQSLISRNKEHKYSAVPSSSFEDISDSGALEEKSCKKPAPRLQSKELRLAGLPSLAQSSTQEEPLMSGASKRSKLASGIKRSLPQGGGCLQPSASYTKKKHTHTNVTIGMSKIPKVVSSKVSLTHHLMPSKNNVTAISGLNCDKNGPPDNVEKNLHTSTNVDKNAICATSSDKSSELSYGKHVANQLSEQPLARNLLAAHKSRGIRDLKMISGSTFLAADKNASTKNTIPSTEVPCSQHDTCHYGNHPSPKYHIKPSGLRMPSPSLGYFHQAKATASHSALKLQFTQLYDLSVFCDRPLGKLNEKDISRLSSPHATANTLAKLSHAAVDHSIGVATPGQQFISSLNSRVPYIANLGSQMTQKPNLKTEELRIMGVQKTCISGTHKRTNSQQLLDDNYSGTVTEEPNLKQSLRSPTHDHGEIMQGFHEENGKLQTIDVTFDINSRYSNRQPGSNDFENVNDVLQKGRDSCTLGSSKFSISQNSLEQGIGDVNCHQEEVAASETCLGEYQRPSNFYLQENTTCPKFQYEGTSICNIDQLGCLVSESLNDEKNTDQGISSRSESSFGSSKETHTRHLAESPASERISLGDDSDSVSDHSPTEKHLAPSENHKQLDTDGVLLKDGTLTRKDDIAATMLKPILEVSSKDLVPFSDEWLAARVAAGEDMLTMKTGAVQNSPPEKSLPEPSPWSPVKRSNQDVGPFDCTKYTNLQLMNSSKPS